MSKYYNGQLVELLAPAGTFEIFKEVIRSNCDAVYLGGKKLNMRMHRKNFNFENDELIQAVSLAHDLGKKVYITVNNLHGEEDIKELETYLRFLEKVGPDALIIQDVSIIKMVRDLSLALEIHSSVMMDVHNSHTVKFLKDMGITRIVASRETTLDMVRSFKDKVDIEFEYFVHGDMCISHGAQCTYSGLVFGQSGNRGRCMKPCRWGYQSKLDGKLYNTDFPLATKDMYMYEHIPEMIAAGINSFKIEGRMRDADYLIGIVNAYGDAIDRYIADPTGFDPKIGAEQLFESRKRDFTTFYAFGKSDDIINKRLEGTGAFYSTGKPFSTATDEREIAEETTARLRTILKSASDGKPNAAPIEYSVKVNSLATAKVALAEGVDCIYLSDDVFLPDHCFKGAEIKELTAAKGSTKVCFALPHMLTDTWANELIEFLSQDLGLDGLLITNLGAIQQFKHLGLPMAGDSTLNIYNPDAAVFYKDAGLSSYTLSVEPNIADLIYAAKHTALPMEVIVHGAPTVMLLKEDLYESAQKSEVIKSVDNTHVSNQVLVLVDENGREHPVYKDNRGQCHLLPYKDICYLPILDGLHDIGIDRFRIEACHYTPSELRQVIRAYKENDLDFKPLRGGHTYGALEF